MTELQETESKIVEKINFALNSIQSFQKDNHAISSLKYDAEVLLNTVSRHVTKKSTKKRTTDDQPSSCFDVLIEDLKNYISLVDSEKSVVIMEDLFQLKNVSASFKKIEENVN
eukprot:gene10087-2509_t